MGQEYIVLLDSDEMMRASLLWAPDSWLDRQSCSSAAPFVDCNILNTFCAQVCSKACNKNQEGRETCVSFWMEAMPPTTSVTWQCDVVFLTYAQYVLLSVTITEMDAGSKQRPHSTICFYLCEKSHFIPMASCIFEACM